MGRKVTVATCALNQWALDFEGNLQRILKMATAVGIIIMSRTPSCIRSRSWQPFWSLQSLRISSAMWGCKCSVGVGEGPVPGPAVSEAVPTSGMWHLLPAWPCRPLTPQVEAALGGFFMLLCT
uniref:NAD synthetase 1 n=1 Tax=Ovis aries TaxID=9940 RepID=A0AC11E352_SHEEP